MACGDSDAQWAPTLGTSTWTGTLGSSSLTLVLATAEHAAVAVVGIVPLVGTWAVQGDRLVVSVATGGITYVMDLGGSCSGGAVTSASGGATDALGGIHSVSMTRVL